MATVSLVGMPGVGKSTVGVVLAKRLALSFIDTDLVIQEREGCTLQQTLEMDGYGALRAIEQEVVLALQCDDAVVATGGSAVYSAQAMAHLSRQGPGVYLRARGDILCARSVVLPHAILDLVVPGSNLSEAE